MRMLTKQDFSRVLPHVLIFFFFLVGGWCGAKDNPYEYLILIFLLNQ